MIYIGQSCIKANLKYLNIIIILLHFELLISFTLNKVSLFITIKDITYWRRGEN